MSAVLRASEIPCMVDVDGHIDENLTRWGQGCHVRALAEVLEPRWEGEHHGDMWAMGGDSYHYWAADEWMPQPPNALEPWERDLHGVRRPQPIVRSVHSDHLGGGSYSISARIVFDAAPLREAFQRAEVSMRRLTDALNRVPVTSFSKPEPEPTQTPRERALDLRRNRNTGPDRQPFHRRGRA